MELIVKEKYKNVLDELNTQMSKDSDASSFNINENFVYNSLLEFCIYVLNIINGFDDKNLNKINFWSHNKLELDEIMKYTKHDSFILNEIPMHIKNIIYYDYYKEFNGQLYKGIIKLFSEIGYEFISNNNELRNINEYKNFIEKINKFAEQCEKDNNHSILIDLSNKVSHKICGEPIFDGNITNNHNIGYMPNKHIMQKEELSQNTDLKEINYDLVKNCINELNSYIGLSRVKREIKELVSLIKMRKIREERGLKNPEMSYHLCFLGNPGTGKTTVARILAKIYKSLGIVKSDNFIEVDRQDLIGGYVGQTAIKTKNVIKRAYGGILFIDEAYSLTNKGSNNDYGQEAIEVLLKEMEDHRDNLVVIVAGYNDLMIDFLNSNPGLKSRFNTFINFEDYDKKELMDILKMMCRNNDYTLACDDMLLNAFDKICKNKDSSFSNARYVRNLFESAIKKQAIRVSNISNINDEDIKQIKFEDFEFLEENNVL